MKKLPEEKQSDITDALSDIFLNIEVNGYVEESVAVGRMRIGEKVFAEDCLKDMGFGELDPCEMPQDFEGSAIGADGCVADKDINGFYRKSFFNFGMSMIFEEAAVKTKEFGTDGMMLFDEELRDYINGVFPLFVEVSDIEFEYDEFDLVSPVSLQTIRGDKRSAGKLLADIMLGRARAGMCVDRYFIKSASVPDRVMKLLREEDGRKYLECDAVNGMPYKMALISSLDFIGKRNVVLFDMKLSRRNEMSA